VFHVAFRFFLRANLRGGLSKWIRKSIKPFQGLDVMLQSLKEFSERMAQRDLRKTEAAPSILDSLVKAAMAKADVSADADVASDRPAEAGGFCRPEDEESRDVEEMAEATVEVSLQAMDVEADTNDTSLVAESAPNVIAPVAETSPPPSPQVTEDAGVVPI
jgi:hypothetical protein